MNDPVTDQAKVRDAALRSWFADYAAQLNRPSVAEALLHVVQAAHEVDVFLDPRDRGAPWEFGGKRVSEDSALALLSLHDYLNDLEAAFNDVVSGEFDRRKARR